ncbi:MAG: ECF-type sigma factor [Proteobacteria bacterium]|nr:ECF-type sigma factor [Pseudomonadota bacterium]
MELEKKQFDDEPILSLIQGVKDGRIDPSTIDKDIRIKCVEVLWLEGYKTSEMAQVLKCSDKTIKRDLSEIREINAISPDVNLAKTIIGEYLLKARNSHSYLSRLASSKEGPINEKAQAEYYAHIVISDSVSKLQSLGYLPNAAKAVVGDIFHHYDNNDELENLKIIGSDILELETLFPNDKEISKIKSKVHEMASQAEVKPEEKQDE